MLGGYQGVGLPSLKNPPVGPSSGAAAQTIDAAPSSTLLGAPRPPMSVRAQPGETALNCPI